MKDRLTGEYAGRPVFLRRIGAEPEATLFNVRDSVVLILSEKELISTELFEQLIKNKAICIWVAGDRASVNLDILLATLSNRVSPYHIMTGVVVCTSTDEAIDDFLAAAIPDPAIIDECWRSYCILTLGSEYYFDLVASYLIITYPTNSFS